MTLRIVCLHGMNQQQYTAARLQQHWYQLLEQGLIQQHIALDLNEFEFCVPFYADLITQHHFVNHFNLGTFSTKDVAHGRVPAAFTHFKPHPLWQHYYALARDYAIKELLQGLDYFPKLDAKLMQRFLIEAYLYLSDQSFIQEVHDKIAAAIQPKQPTLILAHSLGSVIAYNLLKQHPEYQIQGLISLASPLAFKLIQAKILHPIQRPACILGNWLNFYSTDDFLSAFPLSSRPFDFQPAIQNQAIHTNLANPHQLQDYLQHPLVITSLSKILKNSA
jgi:hypothetical protein